MKQSNRLLVLVFFLLIVVHASAKNYLQACWDKQVKPFSEKYLAFAFQEKLNELEHNFEPWQETNYTVSGIIWLNSTNFYKQDTLRQKARTYFSKTELNKENLLYLNYGDKDLLPITQSNFINQTIKTDRYSPSLLVNYFYEHKILPDKESNNKFAVYKATINKTVVSLFINKADGLVSKITTLTYDDNDEDYGLFGDISTSLNYSNYTSIGKLYYPQSINIEKINGKIKDQVIVSNADMAMNTPKLLEKPGGYKILEDNIPKANVTIEKYDNHIHFIHLKHTEDKVLVVEFADFLLVAEAPLNSQNGELIIEEVKKIAPNKPIKYFVFGHYHPHYLGGVRAFIHHGTKIICSPEEESYVTYLANASHTLNPDSLEIQPKPL